MGPLDGNGGAEAVDLRAQFQQGGQEPARFFPLEVEGFGAEQTDTVLESREVDAAIRGYQATGDGNGAAQPLGQRGEAFAGGAR
jgi:hypothetical protein